MPSNRLITTERAERTSIREREIVRFKLLIEVLEEIPIALDVLSASTRRRPKLVKTTVNLHGHAPKCEMNHWHLDGPRFVDRTTAWWQLFRNEPPLVGASTWLREDGEIVCCEVLGYKKLEMSTRALPLDQMGVTSLRQLFHALHNPFNVL